MSQIETPSPTEPTVLRVDQPPHRSAEGIERPPLRTGRWWADDRSCTAPCADRPKAQRRRDGRGGVDHQSGHARPVAAEDGRAHAADRERCRDRAAVIPDRRADRRDADCDVLVRDREPPAADGLQLVEQILRADRQRRRERRAACRPPRSTARQAVRSSAASSTRGAAPACRGSAPPSVSASDTAREPSSRSMQTASRPRRMHRNTVSPVVACNASMCGSAA